MAIETFNRYEYKYLIDKKFYQKLTDTISDYMEPDKYNIGGKAYTIANIYYDTKDDFLIRTSLSKPAYKEKLRLRSYGVPSLSDMVFLEIKKKYKGIVNKRRTNIILSDAYSFIDKRYLEKDEVFMNHQVVNEICYFLGVYHVVPKVYLAYNRTAFFARDNPELRISFDTNIRTRRYDLRLEYGDYGKDLLDDNLYLMEIKAERSIPLWLTKMLSDYEIKKMSFSKYGTEFKNYLNSTDEEMRIVVNG